MKHNPADPKWPDRDRFVLSAGHASMLLYACLHLSGYDLSLDDIKQFRQLGSHTPGHPENFETPGVETTTGPLGQGFGNAVGMAMAEKFLREQFGAEACDHHIFAICSDGDLMEGVASEAASLAGHLRLGRLRLPLRRQQDHDRRAAPSLSFSQEDVPKRFEAYGWHTLTVEDGNDLDAIEAAIRAGIAEEERPTLISLQHGDRLRLAARRHAERAQRPDARRAGARDEGGARLGSRRAVPRARARCSRTSTSASAAPQPKRSGRRTSSAGPTQNVELAAEWHDAWAGRPRAGFAAALPVFDAGSEGRSRRASPAGT